MRDVPLGARTATMGGAGVASGIDSAMPFLNPSGIAGTPNDTLSVSATVYSFIVASPDQYFRPNGLAPRFGTDRIVTEDSSISQVAALPTGLAYFAHLSDEKAPIGHVLGLSISVPIYEDREQDALLIAEGAGGRVTARQIAVERFRMAFLGPSYGVRIGEWLRIGTSVLAYWADASFDEHLLLSRTATGGPSLRNARNQINATSFGVTAIVGAQAKIRRIHNGDLWAGLAFETRGIPFAGSADITATTDAAGVDPVQGQLAARQSTTGEADFFISRPFRISAGVAYEKPQRYALAADLHLHPPLPDLVSGEGAVSALAIQTGQPPAFASAPFRFKIGTRTIVNPSIGAEIQPFTKVVFRAGVFTDFDVGERPNSRLDWYGATLGVGHKTDPLGATYGVVYRYGDGSLTRVDELGPNETAQATIDYTAHGFMLVLSASLDLGVDAFVGRSTRSPFQRF